MLVESSQSLDGSDKGQTREIIRELKKRGVRLTYVPFLFWGFPFMFECEEEDADFVRTMLNRVEISRKEWKSVK